MAMERLTLTVEEAGEALGLSRAGAYNAAKSGDLPVVRVGRRILVPRRALMALLEAPVAGGIGMASAGAATGQ